MTHDTNLAIECLRRTLLKYEEEKGKLPPTLYLQLDNGPDQKSRQFLAFLAYLVETNKFHTIKVSYLMVGHTHEDVDQYFSCISRYIKKTLKMVLSVHSLLRALMDCFKTPCCVPRCTEEIKFTFDTKVLSETFMIKDPLLSCFDLDEKKGDKVHFFVFCRHVYGKAHIQFKLKSYSNAIYMKMMCFIVRRWVLGK